MGDWIAPLDPRYGEKTVISCPLEGNPPASYQWYFEKWPKNISHNDRMPINPGSYLNITFLNNNRTLYFNDTKEEHSGYYICSAENHLGNKTYDDLEPLYIQSKVITITLLQFAIICISPFRMYSF